MFGKNLMLRFSRSTEVNPPFQIVFAVSARLGDAHRRNLIKRRMREAMLEILRSGAVTQAGFDLAILPKKETADLPFVQICDELKMALRRLPKK